MPVHLLACEVGGQRDVLCGGEHGDQVEGLEDKADVVASQFGEPGVIEAPDLDVALKLATEGSKHCNRKVEVRPFFLGD